MTSILVPVVWSMLAGACFAVGIIHFGTWVSQPARRASLAFSVLAASMVFIAMFELALMQTRAPAEFVSIQRWMHVPIFAGVVSMVVFVRAYFGTGRLWLAWAVCALRLLTLVLDFASEGNLEYSSITSLEQIDLLGRARVSAAVGIVNPWVHLGELSAIMLAIFIADASWIAWRRGDRRERRRALVVGGSLVIGLGLATVNTVLLHATAFVSIYLNAVLFTLVVIAVGIELSADVARSSFLAGELARKNVELQQSERRVDEAAEAAALGIWEWDVRADKVWMSDRCRSLFGISPDEPVDFDRFLEALQPDDREAARKAAGTRSEDETFEREYRVIAPGGSVRWIHTRGSIDRDASGDAVLMRGISFDVTARKEAEERFRHVVEAAGNGLIMVNSEGFIELVNARAEAMFGYPREELVGRPLEVLVPEKLRAGHVGNRRGFGPDAAPRMMAGRVVFGRRKDGSEIPLEVGLTSIRVQGGAAVLASILDVSERRQAEILLKQERAFLRQVIDINPNLIFAKDREGRFTLANRSVAALYGTTVEDLVGRKDSDFNAVPEEVEAFRRADLEVMDTLRERFIAEEHITDAAGEGHYLQTVKRPLLGENGKADHVLGVATDITARKETEMELARQRNELAHLARVAMVSELSGSIAHELNQPLTAILSNAQAALRFMDQDAPDFAEVRAILQDIVHDDKRAGQVIQGMRLLLKKGELRREPVQINEVVRDVLRLVRSDMLDIGIGVSTELAPGLPIVSGDGAQLQQVLMNLIANGCDSMASAPAWNRRLVVSTVVAGGEQVQVNVIDQGPGISADMLDRVFEPFYTTKAHGLGMGLSICRNIVTAHGGRLWAHLDSKRGMIFSFTVPIDAGAAA